MAKSKIVKIIHEMYVHKKASSKKQRHLPTRGWNFKQRNEEIKWWLDCTSINLPMYLIILEIPVIRVDLKGKTNYPFEDMLDRW
jgi:hypothetical protein